MSAATLLVIYNLVALVVGFVVMIYRRQPRLAHPPPNFDTVACASTSDGIVVQSLDGKIIWANPAYLRLVGLPEDRVIGRNPLSFCLPLDARKT